jgi:hypothetical protein
MNELMNFLKSITNPATEKWTGNSFQVAKIFQDEYCDKISTFNIESKDHTFNDMSANSSEFDSKVYSNSDQASKCYISIGFLESPYDEGMTRLYVGIHNEEHKIDINNFDWLINMPEDQSVSNSVVVASDSNKENILLNYTSTQILAILSLLKLDIDFEEHRTSLNHAEIDYNESAKAFGIENFEKHLNKDKLDQQPISNSEQDHQEYNVNQVNSIPDFCDVPPHYYDTHFDDNSQPLEQYYPESVPFLFDENNQQMDQFINHENSQNH